MIKKYQFLYYFDCALLDIITLLKHYSLHSIQFITDNLK